MPNVCYNHITITCEDVTELNKLFENELTREEGRDYKNITIVKKCCKGIQFQQLTAWKPEYEWLESLVTKYPNCWVKNEWDEEGGLAGVWVGSVQRGIQSVSWEDLSIDAKYHIFHA